MAIYSLPQTFQTLLDSSQTLVLCVFSVDAYGVNVYDTLQTTDNTLAHTAIHCMECLAVHNDALLETDHAFPTDFLSNSDPFEPAIAFFLSTRRAHGQRINVHHA